MSVKCTKGLIVESINSILDAQPKSETTKVFKSIVNNLMGYMAELGINNRATLKIHEPAAGVFSPYLRKIGEQVKEGNKIFLVKNRDIESSTFLEPSTYNNTEELVQVLLDSGISSELSNQIVAKFKSFADQVDSQLITTNKVFASDLLPLLYGANQVEGKETTYHLPRPVIFSASTALLRWFATDGARTLNAFTDTQIAMIVGAERVTDISEETLNAFRSLDHGGILRGEAAGAVGSLIFKSLNITPNLEEINSPIVSSILTHQLGTLALELGVEMGLIKAGNVVYEIEENGKSVKKSFQHYYIKEATIKTDKIDLDEITNHSKQLDAFFGVNQSFAVPSISPAPKIGRNVKGSIGLVSPQAGQVINKLRATEFTVIDGFHLYMIGADTNNEQLRNKAILLRRKLAGVTFINPSDKLKVHVDLEEGIEAKDQQLLDQIKVIKKYYDSNLINSFYLKWKFMAQHRMMIESDLDPMTAKNVARFLVRPANAERIVVDPAKQDSKAVISFKVAIAQHFDLDVDKTDIQGSLELYNKVMADLDNADSSLSKVITAIQEMSSNPNEVSEENYLDAMLDLHTKYPSNTALVMAVDALAKYQNALETGVTFSTDVIVEADAVTSGFGIGLMLFPSSIMVDMTTELNRVGMTFEGQAPYSEQVKNADGVTPDGYLNFANALFDKFESFPAYLDTDSKTKDSKLMESRFNTFNTIFGPLITNRRKSGKPPFMVLNYEGGTTKVSKELATSLVESLFKHLASMQEQYTNGDAKTKAKIHKDLALMFRDLGKLTTSKSKKLADGTTKPGTIFLPEGLNRKTLKPLLDSNTLHKLTFAGPLYRGSPIKYRDFLINKLTDTLAPAVQAAAAETIVNKEIKEDFIKAGELQYFMFRVLYKELVNKVPGRTEGKLFPSQRAVLAKQLVAVYPKIVLKHQDGKESFIDLVKSTKVQHPTKFEIKLKSRNVSSRLLTYSFAPPGVSAVTRTIQGVDAVELQDSISLPFAENKEIPLLPIHDAVMQVIGGMPATKAAYNNVFKSIASSPEFDVFKQLADLVDTTWKSLDAKQKLAVTEAYHAHAHINRDKKVKDKISFADVFDKVQETAKEVQENRHHLGNAVETATSDHMYIAASESTENVDFSAQEAIIKKSLEDSSKDYQHSSNYLLIKENRELFRILTTRLKKLYPNIKLEEREVLIDKYGEKVLGNAIGTAIQYSRSKGALDTVPHEYAHIYLNLLEHTSIIGKQISEIQAIHDVDRKEAKEILATEMGRIFTDKVLQGKGKKTESIVKRVWAFIKKIFKPLYTSSEKMYAQHIYNELAWKLINGITGEALTATPKKGYTLQKFDTILENNPWGAEVIDIVLNKMLPEAMVVGSLALVGAGNIYRKGMGSLHDIDFAMPFSSFSPKRGLEGNIKTYFPESKLLYKYDNSTDIEKATEKVLTYVVPPVNTKMANIKRFGGGEFGRVIAWDVVDVNNPTNVLGTYRADAIKDPNAPDWSVRSILVKETTTGVEAVLVDFLTDVGIGKPKTIYSSYLGARVKVSNPKAVFAAKNNITKEDFPREKDVMDFNLFKPNKDGITPPDLFGEVTKGSSFLDLMEDSATWHNNAPLTQSAMSIFTSLGKQDIHYDAPHAEHLQNILQKLVLEHMSNAEDVVVQSAFIKGKTRGGFSEDLRKVIIQLNENAPITYAEQSPQEVYVHETLHAVIDHVLKQHPQLHAELNKLHREAIKHITVEDFLIDGIKSDEAAERAVATQQYEYVYKDSTEFLIYALTNKGLVNKMMNTTPKRPDKYWEGEKFMDKLINLVEYLINIFNTQVRNKKLTSSQYQEFYNLSLKIATINSSHERSLMTLAKGYHIEALVEKGMDEVVDVMSKTTIKVGEKLFKDTEIGNTIRNIKGLPKSIKKSATSKAFLRAFHALSDIEQIEALALFTKDLIVGTGSIEIMDLVLKAKGIIDSNRIHRAKSLVKKLRAHTKSKKKIISSESIALTKVLLNTDLQSLLTSTRFTLSDIIKLIQHPQLLHNKIKQYEARVGISNNMFYQQQTEGLASFMVRTSSTSGVQALNAHRMYQLHQQLYGLDVNPNAGIVQELDILVSLMALQLVPKDVKQKALRVIEAETAIDADNNLVSTILDQRKVLLDETLEHNFNNSPYAMIKGYTRNSYNSNVEVVSAPLSNKKEMLKEGYVLSHELPYIPGVNKAKFGLYVNTYNPEAGRTTGVLPYSGQKSKGTTLFEILSNDPAYQKQDPITGNMVGDASLIRPVILEYVEKQKELLIAQVTSGKMGNNTQLIPLINNKGEIYDFRVMMTTALQEKLLDPDMTHENVMSQLSIHYIDKKMSKHIEKSSMDYLVKVMNEEYKGKRDKSFINILDKKYYAKYYLPLPESFKALIKANEIKTDEGSIFPIKKEELHILFGTKDMSVRDLPHFNEYPAAVRKGLLRLDAATLGVVRVAVSNIIMKMPEVLEDNIFSNTLILILNGLNPVKAVRLQVQAVKYLKEWKSVTAEMMDLYYTYHGGNFKDKDILLRLKALSNSLEKSPIFELMDRHLFTSMVEEIHLRESSAFDIKMQSLEEKMGKYGATPIVGAAKLLYMTKTTAPYQAMQEIFQMSDFLARYALNEHLKTTKMSVNERKRVVYESFVLYDVPGTSRAAAFINKTGFTLFYSYYIKMQRAIFKTAIRRTNSTLALLGLQNAADVDVPDIFDAAILTGNFAPPLSNPVEILEHVIKLPGVEFIEEFLP